MKAQFSIFRLFLLTLAVAVVLAISMRFEAPWVARVVVGLYLLSLAVWGVIRGPGIYRELREFAADRARLREQKKSLEEDVDRRRKKKADA